MCSWTTPNCAALSGADGGGGGGDPPTVTAGPAADGTHAEFTLVVARVLGRFRTREMVPLGLGRVVVSADIEAPNMLADMV
jgi:hypothetical protein